MFNTPEGNRILRFGSIVLVMLVIFLAAQVLYTLRLTSDVGEQIAAITVDGKGEVVSVPDVAMFDFGVQETAKTVSDAQKVVTEKIDRALSIVKAAGVEDKDIKTVSYNISPHYQYTQGPCNQFGCQPGRQTIDGYEVSQMIQVKIRNTSNAGKIVGDLGSAQVTNISSLTFTVDDIEKVQADAEAKAIADAQEKAEALADNLGVRLGKIIGYNNGYYPMPVYERLSVTKAGAADAMVASPELPSGENKIISNVSITYELR